MVGDSAQPESPGSQVEEPTSATALTPVSTTSSSDVKEPETPVDVSAVERASPSRGDDWSHDDFSNIRVCGRNRQRMRMG